MNRKTVTLSKRIVLSAKDLRFFTGTDGVVPRFFMNRLLTNNTDIIMNDPEFELLINDEDCEALLEINSQFSLN